MAEYDPANYETCPEVQKDFAGEVIGSLRDGDLQPLASYLRAGHQLEPTMATEIAEMIEQVEWGRYHIVIKARRPGEVGFTTSLEWHERKMRIAVFIEERLERYGRGGYDAALSETMDKFEVKSATTIEKARKHLRGYLATSKSAPDWDHWAYLKDFY